MNKTILSLVAFLTASVAPAQVIGSLDYSRQGPRSLAVASEMSEARTALTVTFPGISFTATPTITQSFLDTVDVFVVYSAQGNNQPITPLSLDEQAALADYLRTGGSLLMHVDNDTFSTSAPAVHASMLEPLGLCAGGRLSGTQWAAVDDPSLSPITDGPYGQVTKFYQYYPGAFTELGYALPLAQNGLGPTLAILERGRSDIPSGGPISGRAVLFGDAALFANGNLNLRDHSHEDLLLNIFDHLLRPPARALAGDDQAVDEGAAVTLDGSASEGDPLTYLWTQIAGPAVSFGHVDTATTSFIAPWVPIGNATLTFHLEVSDGYLASGDTVDVTVINVNHPPVADAGDNRTADEGGAVELDGSASYDEDGDPITYSWAQILGPVVALSDSLAERPTFTAPSVGPQGELLRFALTVDDGTDTSVPATVDVVVDNVNAAPVADAGADQTVDERRAVTLDGTSSRDPDQDALSYAWTQLGGPGVTLSDASASTPTFTAPDVAPGGAALCFRLTVDDGLLDAFDDVEIHVANVNDPPDCSRAFATPAVLWPPNHKLVPVEIAGVSDPQNDRITITFLGVYQDEPVVGLGHGDSSPDAVVRDGVLYLRAERSGIANGRVYHVAFRADDLQGGSCTGAVTVRVPKSRRDPAAVDEGPLHDSRLQ